MRDNFTRALAVTLQWEGGYVNHPHDPGGATNKGITLNTYRRYKKGATVKDLKRIPPSMVEKIYKDGYWDKVKGDRLAPGVDLATFDYAVNSGPGTAKRKLMGVLGGPDYVTVQKLCRARLASYRTFRHWRTFGKGWTRRINAVEAKGVAWAKDGGKAVVSKEAAKSDKLARQQGAGGAGGAIGGGGVAVDQLSGWPLVVALVVVGVVVAVLIVKAKRNKDRADAYRNELENGK